MIERTFLNRHRPLRGALLLAIVGSVSLSAPLAQAGISRQGAWPKDERKVSLDWEGERAGAVRELSKAAGWNLVVGDLHDHDRVSVHVKGVPADAVLEAIFEASTGEFEAKRTGELILLREIAKDAPKSGLVDPEAKDAGTKVPSATDAGTLPSETKTAEPKDSEAKGTKPAESDDGEEGTDRVVKGESIRIEKDEIVHDVSVVGGSVEVFGKVTGDLVVVGGGAHVHEGAHVMGDALAIGGTLEVDKGGRIDGDTGVVGGVLSREEGSVLRGKKHHGPEKKELRGLDIHADTRPEGVEPSFVRRVSSGVSHAFSLFAMLFVFGSVLLAVRGDRMESLRQEAALRPMRNIGLGIVGSFAFLAGLLILCVTIVGIPLAVAGALAFAFALYAGVVATSGVAGELLLRHRTKNAYAHLALGAGIFVLLTQIPSVGTLIAFLVSFLGLGAIVATRAVPKAVTQPGAPTGPYRG